jgi:hypothetical protein
MRLYGIAIVVAVILFAVLGFLQHILRQQVHRAHFGNQEISPWDARYSNPLLGQYGIWTLHKRAYERSGLRLSFLAILLALLACLIVGVCHFFFVRHGF